MKRKDARTKPERNAGSGRFKRLRAAHKHGETAAKASGPTAKTTATAQLRQSTTPKSSAPAMSMGMAMKPGADM